MSKAYYEAMELLATIIDHVFDSQVPIVSVYLLSADNLQRDPADLQAATDSIEWLIRDRLPEIVSRHQVSACQAGASQRLSASMNSAISSLCSNCPMDCASKLYILTGYDPRDEIEQAIAKDAANPWPHLWVKERVDLVIRSGGSRRLSNFLPLQSAYAELVFLDPLWNSTTPISISEAIDEYSGRERRFGR